MKWQVCAPQLIKEGGSLPQNFDFAPCAHPCSLPLIPLVWQAKMDKQ
jgi:hypothetical protein